MARTYDAFPEDFIPLIMMKKMMIHDMAKQIVREVIGAPTPLSKFGRIWETFLLKEED